MTVYLITAIHRFIGESFDTKPTTGVPVGSTFFETDTKNTFIYSGSAWVFTGSSIVLAIRGVQAIKITEEEDEYQTAYIVAGALDRMRISEAVGAVVSLPLAGTDAFKISEAEVSRLFDNLAVEQAAAFVEEVSLSVTE